MPKFLRQTNNRSGKQNSSAALKQIKRNIYWQAGLALMTIILTVVIVFAMSAAWYTNIVQASGLVFQAESWGFEGDIVVNTDVIEAAPVTKASFTWKWKMKTPTSPLSASISPKAE